MASFGDALVDGAEVRGGLHDETLHAESQHLLHVHVLGIGVEVACAHDGLVAVLKRHLLHAAQEHAGPDVGVVQDDDGDHVGRLAGERLRLRVGHVARLADGALDALAGFLAQLVALAVEVVGDARGGDARLLGNIGYGDAVAAHLPPS